MKWYAGEPVNQRKLNMKYQKYKTNRERIKRRIRAAVKGSRQKPRLSVFRSNRYTYAQLIDDTTGTTICCADDRYLADGKDKTKAERAFMVGVLLAERAENKVTKVVFDRGGYRYQGRVKALADGARKGGLQY